MPDPPTNSEPEPHESPDTTEYSEDEMDYDGFCRTYLNLPDSESNSPAASVAPSSEHDDYDPQVSYSEEEGTRMKPLNTRHSQTNSANL